MTDKATTHGGPAPTESSTSTQTWRCRFLISAFAILPDVTITLSGIRWRFSSGQEDGDGSRTYIADAYPDCEDIKAAAETAREAAEDLADRIAFLTLSKVDTVFISAGPETVTPGEVFLFSFNGGRARRNCIPIEADRLTSLDERSVGGVSHALRRFRLGISAEDRSRGYLELWTALESIAENHARSGADFVKIRCAACGAEESTGRPRSHGKVRELYERHGFGTESKNFADTARDKRGALAHRKAILTREARADLFTHYVRLRGVTATAVSGELGVHPHAQTSPVYGDQVLVLPFVAPVNADNLEFHLHAEGGDLSGLFALAGIAENLKGEHETQVSFGLIFPLPIPPPIAWPRVVWPSSSG